jgi:hypothetical protein
MERLSSKNAQFSVARGTILRSGPQVDEVVSVDIGGVTQQDEVLQSLLNSLSGSSNSGDTRKELAQGTQRRMIDEYNWRVTHTY